MRVGLPRIRQVNRDTRLFCRSYRRISSRLAVAFSYDTETCRQFRWRPPDARRCSSSVGTAAHSSFVPNDLNRDGESDLRWSTARAKVSADTELIPRAHLKLDFRDGRETLRENSSSEISVPPPYGKWQSLALDIKRLEFESDVTTPSEVKRLVDLPENTNDIELWTCLLDFCHRRMGQDGVKKIWQAVSERRNLSKVEGLLAEAFWNTVLEVAVQDEQLLQSVWIYAEWLCQTHGVRWPRLYATVIPFYLLGRPLHEALHWHFRLSPNFDPGHEGFATLLRIMITTKDSEVQAKLQSLYAASIHRNMYDELIPHLYAIGESSLAQSWRKLLQNFDDKPTSLASRPFLRYLATYWPMEPLSEEELAIIGSTEEIPEDEEYAFLDGEESLRQLMNRVHGMTFGIHEKSYNDKLGAKWFATTWVPLDFAISAVRALGVDGIGPLSLQSIALRENDLEGIRRRLDQLEAMQISLGTSKYVKAVRHLVAINDFETLQALLHSDLHPDVFDDQEMQAQLLASCSAAGDWDKYRLVLVVRSAVSMESLMVASNRLLLACLRDEGRRMALTVLEEMDSRGIQIFPSSSQEMSKCIVRNVPFKITDNGMDVDFYLALCHRLAVTRFPPPVLAWQKLLVHLDKLDRLDDLEKLCLEAVRVYVQQGTSEHSAINVYKLDVPDVMRKQSPYADFVPLPSDLSLGHPDHPLRQIFDSRMVAAIAGSGFRGEIHKFRSTLRRKAHLDDPVSFHFARGVRLLAICRDKGLHFDIRAIQAAVIECIVKLYGPLSRNAPQWLRHSRSANVYTVAEIKKLCDLAWGSDLLPSVADLEAAIEKAERDALLKAKSGPLLIRRVRAH